MRRYPSVPVRTTLILLRPAADGPELTGRMEKRLPEGDVYDWFKYDVVRVWEQPVEAFLKAGLTVLPLAPVSNIGLDRFREVLATVAERLRQEAPPDRVATLWKATTMLLSLRYRREQIDQIVMEVSSMSLGIRGFEESWLYQDYFQQGKAEGLAEGEAKGKAEGLVEGEAKGLVAGIRQALLFQGRAKLGEPDERVLTEIASLTDRDLLNRLLVRVLEVSSWDELLSPPSSTE